MFCRSKSHQFWCTWHVTSRIFYSSFYLKQKSFYEIYSIVYCMCTYVILTGDVRNDIYVTIKQGEFTRGNKTADKNVEVTVLVCNKQGEPLKVEWWMCILYRVIIKALYRTSWIYSVMHWKNYVLHKKIFPVLLLHEYLI